MGHLDQNTSEWDVVIVGGGIAGLTSAVGLCDAGLRVLVLEKENYLGGRACSWIDAKTKDPVHIGPHIFLTEYPNMFKFMDRIGTRDKIVWQDGKFITIVDGATRIVMKQSELPAPFHFVPSIIADKTQRHIDKMSNIPIALYAMQLTEKDFLRLDSINAYSLLQSFGVTEAHIERFWAFTSMSIMNVPIELCSAGALMRFFQRMIGHASYNVGFPDGGLGDTFAPQACEYIERKGGQVWTHTGVKQFTGTTSQVTGIELEDGRQIQAKYCIAALPPRALRRVAKHEWIAQYPSFANLVRFYPSPYISVFLWFDRKLTDLQFWARTFSPNDLNCDFYDLSNINTGWSNRPSVITSNIIYSDRVSDLSDDEIVKTTLREMAEFLPEVQSTRLVHSVINRIPMAIHCPYPGTERWRASTKTPIQGLFLAGDWIQTHLPSSMESAAMAGWMAAEQVLQSIGKPQTLAVTHKSIEGLAGLVNRTMQYLPHKQFAKWTGMVSNSTANSKRSSA